MSTTTLAGESNCLALPAADLAKLLAVSERHLWSMHSTGKLGPRPVALGRARRWIRREVEAWLAAGAPPRERWETIRKDVKG